MTAEEVDVLVAAAVANALDRGAQPARVLVGTAAYRALLTRAGLAPRAIGKASATSVRALVDGFDLPVDCDRSVADDNAVCMYVRQFWGRA